MRLLLTDAEPATMCFYAGGDPSHPRAIDVVHDERGCVPCCDACRRWRACQEPWNGHHVSCPEAGALVI